MLIVIPYLHDLSWYASLEILKGSFVESGCHWVLWSAHRLVMILDVTRVEMRVEELGITQDAKYSMKLGPSMEKFMSDGSVSRGALSSHESQKSEIDHRPVVTWVIRNQVQGIQVYQHIREESEV